MIDGSRCDAFARATGDLVVGQVAEQLKDEAASMAGETYKLGQTGLCQHGYGHRSACGSPLECARPSSVCPWLADW